MFRRAEKRQAKLRLALCGPAGAGKTFSALLIARGLCGDEGRIGLVDTERGSGEVFADLTAYDVAPLEPPYTPARYVDQIHDAEQAGYDVLIVDSLSHAWAGSGGVLEMHDKATAASRTGNSFAAWREVTPQHNALVDAVLGARLHVIVTMRTKTAYDLVDDGKGKKRPIKVGLAPVQREGMEYEFTTVIDLSVDGHVATATKDRTGLYDGAHWVPDIGTGEALREWLERGVDPVAESKRVLRRLKGQASKIGAVPHLTAWWRKRGAEIALLTKDDAEALTAYCADRKAAILAALEQVPAADWEQGRQTGTQGATPAG